MGVHDGRARLVGLAEEGEETVGLGGEVVSPAHGEEILVLQMGHLLQVAEDGAGLVRLLPLQEGQHVGGGAVQQHQRGGGGVMLVHHAGGQGAFSLLQLLQHGRGDDHPLAHAGQCVGGDGTGTEEGQILPLMIVADAHDGGFQTDVALPAVDDDVHSARQVGDDVLSHGGGGLTRQIGRGSGHGEVAALLQKRVGDGMIGTAHRHGVKTAGGGVGDTLSFGQDHRQRPGHEGRRQTEVQVSRMGISVCLGRLVDVDDEGIVGGTALGGVDPLRRLSGQSVAAETVHRLGGEHHKPPLAEDAGGFLEILYGLLWIRDLDNLGLHSHSVSCSLSFSAVSAAVRASIMAPMFPFMNPSRSKMDRPMRWSVTRLWG